MKCRVLNCNNWNGNKASSCSFFTFPTNKTVSKKWVQFCRQGEAYNPRTSVICMQHFTDDDFENLVQFNMGFAKNRVLKRGAVPTIFEVDIPDEGSPPQDEISEDEFIVESYCEVDLENKQEYLAEDGDVNALTSSTPDLFYYDSSIQNDEVLETLCSPAHERNGQPQKIIPQKKPTKVSLYKSRQTEIDRLKGENAYLQKENKKQRVEIAALKQESDLQLKRHASQVESLQRLLESLANEVNNIEDKLSSIFTNGQITKLKTGSKRLNWTEKDIAQSITLYAASPKAYRLLYKQGFPLPAVRTLHSWTEKLDFSRGLIQPVFRLLAATTHMDESQKICVLSFGEMELRQSYCSDNLTSSRLAPTHYVQVAMLRGLFSKWMQPIFYDFDRKMTFDIVQSILQQSLNCGYNVVAVVCDIKGTKREPPFEDVNITAEKPWFIFNNQKVYVFADVPHLLALLQNHFLNYGFIIKGKVVRKEIILELLSCGSEDFRMTHQISENDLNVDGPQRQNVKTAAKLFSHTVAQALTMAASLGHLGDQNWSECCHIFEKTNDWFAVFNVKFPHGDSKNQCHAYGIAIAEQNKIVDEMTDLIKSIRVIGRQNLQQFQKGIIQSNNALKMMSEDIQYRFNAKYVLTHHLHQDVLENFFYVMRSKVGLHELPDQQQFQYRLKLFLLGNHKGSMSDAGNVEDNNLSDIEITQPLTGIMLKNLNSQSVLWPVEEVEFEESTGYVCRKQSNNIPSSSSRSSNDPLSSAGVHF